MPLLARRFLIYTRNNPQTSFSEPLRFQIPAVIPLPGRSRFTHGLPQHFQEAPPPDLPSPHHLHMTVGDLGVYKLEIPFPEPLDKVVQCDLRCLAHEVKHRFAEENSPDSDTIEPPYELPFLIGFNGMGITAVVQLGVCVDHVLRDPGPGLPLAGDLGATPDDLSERRVEQDLVTAGLQNFV